MIKSEFVSDIGSAITPDVLRPGRDAPGNGDDRQGGDHRRCTHHFGQSQPFPTTTTPSVKPTTGTNNVHDVTAVINARRNSTNHNT